MDGVRTAGVLLAVNSTWKASSFVGAIRSTGLLCQTGCRIRLMNQIFFQEAGPCSWSGLVVIYGCDVHLCWKCSRLGVDFDDHQWTHLRS
jgi:hypothetical protein